MRRIRIILAAAFLTGVLLGGIGVGVTMVEWSSLKYSGTKQLGSEYLVTGNFDFELKDDGSKVILERSYYTNRFLEEIEEDPSVPEGIVRYEVTYNSALVKPYLDYLEYDTQEETESAAKAAPGEETDPAAEEPVYSGELRLMRSYFGDDFQIFMENKDEMLNDLKNGKLSSYEVVDVSSVKIRMNPATAARVENRTGW